MLKCTNKAKVQVSSSGGGESQRLCYKHGYAFVKTLMRQFSDFAFGIYIQRLPKPKEEA